MQVNNHIPANYKPLPPIPQRAAVTQAPPTQQPAKATRSVNVQQVVAKSANALQEVRNLTSPTQIKEIGMRCATLTVARIQDNASMLSSWLKSSSLNTLSSPGRSGHHFSSQTSQVPSQTSSSSPPQQVSEPQVSSQTQVQGQTQTRNPVPSINPSSTSSLMQTSKPVQTPNPESTPPVTQGPPTQGPPTQRELMDAKADMRRTAREVAYIETELQDFSKRGLGPDNARVEYALKRLEQAKGVRDACQVKYEKLEARVPPKAPAVWLVTSQEDRDKAVSLSKQVATCRNEVREFKSSVLSAERAVVRAETYLQELQQQNVDESDPRMLGIRRELSQAQENHGLCVKNLAKAESTLNEKLVEKRKMGRELLNLDYELTADALIKDMPLVVDRHLSPDDRLAKINQGKFARSLIEDLGFEPLKFIEMYEKNPTEARNALHDAMSRA